MNWMKLKASLTLAALSIAAGLLNGCYSDPNVSSAGGKFVFPDDPSTGATEAGTGTGTGTGIGTSGAGQDFSKIVVGDFLIISFSDVPPPGIPEQKIRVPQDGKITLPLNVKVKVVGRTTSELQEEIRNAYVPQYYVNLTATVKAEDRVYFVGGEVRSSGRQMYLGEMTVTRAIDTAGGFTDFAKRTNIELRRANGETLKVNWNKVRKNPKLDLLVFPNDHITVPKAVW
jgi:polysaccharide export outer membrane protein